MSLTRDQILSAPDRKTVEVNVPEWGGSVFVRSLSGAERDILESQMRDARISPEDSKGLRARFGVAFISDEAGSALFTLADVEALGAKSGEALTRVLDKGMDLNGMREKNVQELAKN